MVIVSYKGEQGIPRVLRGYKKLQNVIGAYSGLQRVTRGYWELQWGYIIVAGGY